jgi:hypothetical protein
MPLCSGRNPDKALTSPDSPLPVRDSRVPLLPPLGAQQSRWCPAGSRHNGLHPKQNQT